MEVLSAADLRKVIIDGTQTKALLGGIDLCVEAGEQVSIVGRSGAGKSTLLHILGALDPHYEGTVRINGEDLATLSEGPRARLRQRALGFVFQAYNLVGHLDVLANVTLGGRLAGHSPQRERAREMLDRVGLVQAGHRKPGTLSGGEKQRVAIARALYTEPKVVLCDEPTGNLDQATAEQIYGLFGELKNQGVALVIATHDLTLAKQADRCLTLTGGVWA